jgi:hypothetical protein
MIPLARELKYLVYVALLLVEATHILILFFNIDFDFEIFLELISHLLYVLTLLVVKVFLIHEFLVKSIWDVFVGHCVSCQFELVEVILAVDDICVHALVVHQMNFQPVADFHLGFLVLGEWVYNRGRLFLVLCFDYSEAGVLLDVGSHELSLLIEPVVLNNCIPIILYHYEGIEIRRCFKH